MKNKKGIDTQHKVETWSAPNVGKILVNPIYTGVGPFPRLIEDELWIKSMSRMIKERGVDEALRMMLSELQESFK